MNNFPINNNPPQTNQPFKPINLQNPKPQPLNPQPPFNNQGTQIVIPQKIQPNPILAGQGGLNNLNMQPGQINGQQLGGGFNGQQIKMNPPVGQIGGMQGGNQQGGLGMQLQGIQQGGLGLQPKQGMQIQGNQLINMQKPMISQGGLKPLVDHQVQSKETVNLSRDPEQIIQDLIKFINKPVENEIPNILLGIIQLSRDCIDIQLNYISSRFCSITGKNFESDEEILVVQNQIPISGNENDEQYKFDGLFFNVHEFMNRIVINGILDYSLDEIEILLFNGKIKKFCFDTETLQKLFGGEDGLKAKFEQANNYFNGTKFTCPLKGKEFDEGIRLKDGRMFSYEAAKELYLEKQSSEQFNDQIVENMKQKQII